MRSKLTSELSAALEMDWLQINSYFKSLKWDSPTQKVTIALALTMETEIWVSTLVNPFLKLQGASEKMFVSLKVIIIFLQSLLFL